MKVGTLKWFDGKKGFGFIVPNDGGADIFIHESAVFRSGVERLAEDGTIYFDTAINKKTGKLRAERISLEPPTSN
jgi:CspA family cold shock protein